MPRVAGAASAASMLITALAVAGCGKRSAAPEIAAAGDLACGQDTPLGEVCRDAEVSDLAVRRHREHGLAAFLPLGDVQYEFGFYEDFLRFYEPSWGRLKRLSRPTPGDHEYEAIFEGSSPVGYFDYWNGNSDDGAAGPRDRPYYSFDVGAWHLIALNSNCRFVGGCQPGSPQERWLRADLERNVRPCTLAYWHHPRFNSGHHGDAPEMQALWQALYDAGADVVLSAHERVYERFAPLTAAGRIDERRGLRQFTVGTGGRGLDDFKTLPRAGSVIRRKEFGVLFLTLGATSYAWRFATVDGAFPDDGTAACH